VSAKLVSVLAAASMLAASVPAFASVETRSSDAIPAAHAAKAHSRYADDNKPARAGRAARGANGAGEGAAGAGGGGLGISTGVLAGLAGVLGAIGIAVAVQNRSN